MRLDKIIIVALMGVSGFGLARSFWEQQTDLGRLERLQKEVVELRSHVESLNWEIAHKESPEFLEREARDKLGLIKEGERVVILPENPAVLGGIVEDQPAKVDGSPNWKKWWRFLFD